MIPTNGGVVLSVLAFLGTAGLLCLALVIGVWSLVRRDGRLARQAAAGGGAVLLLYLLVLGAVGVASTEQVIAPGSAKYFCELDCHLAYRVTEVRPLEAPAPAGRRMWAVTVQTQFDERTISPRRGREAPLWPNPRYVALMDSAGARYAPSPGLEDALGALGIRSTPITKELRPGESYQTVLVFDLPAGAAPARLVLQEDLFVTRFLIGHERSVFHAPVLLQLQ